MTLFLALLAATAGERIAELVVSQRNAAWAFARGGVEFGRGHFPFMVALHTVFLLASGAEVLLLGRVFLPWLGWPMLVIALASQGLRWWCIGTLGRRWNTRVIVVPGLPLVVRGPYRFLRHPNYVAVIAEGIALPLIVNAWITALAFTAINLVLLLRFRIPVEEKALAFGLAQAGARAGAGTGAGLVAGGGGGGAAAGAGSHGAGGAGASGGVGAGAGAEPLATTGPVPFVG